MIDLDKCSVNGLKEIISFLEEQNKFYFNEWMKSSEEVGFFKASTDRLEEENHLMKKQIFQNSDKQRNNLRVIPSINKRILN